MLARSIALLLALLPAAALAQQPGQKEFFQDFRGDKAISDYLKFIGPNAETIAKHDDAGLRITIPPEQLARETVGLRSTFGLKGDFEITASYEMLHDDRPQDGNGIGFMLYLVTDSAKGDALGVYRLLKVKEGDVYMVTRRSTNKEGKRDTINNHYSAPGKTGQVRLARTGATVKVFALDGDAKEFRELGPYDFVTDNIKRIELMAYPGRADRPIMPQKPVDIRIKNVRIRAESFPFLPAAELRDVDDPQAPVAVAAQPETSRSWLVVVLVIGVFLALALAGVVGIVLFLRMRG